MTTQNNQKEYYRLYIDELGTASTKDLTSEVYILSDCSVKRSECANLKIWADQIKFKYWGRTDIVWHSNEMGHKKNHDIEEQIADLFAYAAKIKYRSQMTGKPPSGDYEQMIVELLDKKIFTVPTGAGREKARLFKEVDPFLIIP